MKTIKFIFGMFLLLSVIAVTVLESLFLVVELGLYFTGSSYNEDLLWMCLFNIPLLILMFMIFSWRDFGCLYHDKFFTK